MTAGTDVAPVVEARELRKVFGPIAAVDGISLDFTPGRIYGLLGPNGSGKTTLIRLLVGLARPTSGTARVLGTEMPERQVLGRIGYMTQADGIYADLSVVENARFFASMYGREEDADTEIEPVHDDIHEDGNGDETGPDEGQIEAHHRAPSGKPEGSTPFLDEPTVGLDPALRVVFWEHFRRLAADAATIVVSSHVMDEADRCDELLLILNGRVLARGSGAQIRETAGTHDLEGAFLRLAGRAAPAAEAPPSEAPPNDREGAAS